MRTNKSWQEHWNDVPAKYRPTDFLRQVGKTIEGVPITKEQLSRLVEHIRETLALGPEDCVLDLCCGNGLVTRELGRHCKRIIGIDFSAGLIEIAATHHSSSKTKYILSSILEITPEMFAPGERFNKIHMLEGLQYLQPTDLAGLLLRLRCVSSNKCSILLGGIPDASRLWDFYDTPERKADFHRRVAEGREAIGTWWDRKQLERIAESVPLSCSFIEQPPELYSARYRFDVLLR